MANVDWSLKHDKVAADKGKWGSVIFCTAYGGDSDAKFAFEALNTKAKESLEKYERMDLALLMEFLVVQDREELESATTYEVREQFAQWAVDRAVVLNNSLDRLKGGFGTPMGGGNMRYEFCLLADWRSINSTMATPRPGSCYSYMVPFIGVVQMGYMSQEQELGLRNDWDENGNLESEKVAIEGNTEDDVGWYYLPLADVVGDYDNVYTLEGGMHYHVVQKLEFALEECTKSIKSKWERSLSPPASNARGQSNSTWDEWTNSSESTAGKPRKRVQLREFDQATLSYALLEQVQADNEEYKYPGKASDRVFHASYRHKHQCQEQCACYANCRRSSDLVCETSRSLSCHELKCHDEHPVARERLDPRVGSGDTVLKSGEERDRLARQYNILLLEVEGAGIWENLPCIMVKGVCDYADSHKNK
ncbi:hypothetical protein MY4824_005460 [Beauveria thailandica]